MIAFSLNGNQLCGDLTQSIIYGLDSVNTVQGSHRNAPLPPSIGGDVAADQATFGAAGVAMQKSRTSLAYF